MSFLWAVIVFIVLAVVGDLLSEEVRKRLEAVPDGILRLGSRRLPKEIRESRLEEWRGELAAMLSPSEGMPISRLVMGTRFALGVAWSAGSIRDELGLVAPRLARLSRNLLVGVLTFTAWSLWLTTLNGDLDDKGVPRLFLFGMVVLMIGLGVAVLQFFAARVVVWVGVNLLIWSIAPMRGDSWVWVLLVITGAITLIGAIVGCWRVQARRAAAAAMATTPCATLAVYLFALLTDAANAPKPLLAVLAFSGLMGLLAWRYLNVALGNSDWHEGTRKAFTIIGRREWSRRS